MPSAGSQFIKSTIKPGAALATQRDARSAIEEYVMMGRRILTVSAAILLVGALAGGVSAKEMSLKNQIVGTWTLVSQADIKKDGTKVPHFGDHPQGMLVFDSHGRFSLMIARPDLPKFSGKSVVDGTADEYKAVMQGIVAQFGTYSVDDASKTFTTHVEGSWFPNIVGQDQKRGIVSLTAAELKYTNATAATGESVEVVWKRAK